jgi:hypothetical protein
MKRLLYAILFAVFAVACTADIDEKSVSIADGNGSDKIVNGAEGSVRGTMLVRFAPSAAERLSEVATRSGATRTGIAAVDAVLEGVNGYAVEPLYVVNEKNRDKVYAAGLHLWYEIRFDAESDNELTATRLAEVAEVSAVQYVHRIVKINQPQSDNSVPMLSLQSTGASRGKIPFDDSFRHYQWNLNNQGDKSEVEADNNVKGMEKPVVGADVNVVAAWKLCKGDPSITVAVFDEGVINTHEDLADNIWMNDAELNGQEGVDDDGNGYKDDIYGFNFTTMKGTITWNAARDTGHGSHVAGIISAVNNNGKGICGIAGGSGNGDGVKIISIQIFNGNDGVTTSNLVRAMQYAADNGAHIMQCSWGYTSAAVPVEGSGMPANDTSYRRYFKAEADAIDYFVNNGGTEDGPMDGGLAIFASGNDSASLPCYPSAYESCIAVAAINPALRPAYYTNFGIGTDICAPGGESLYSFGSILSTVPEKFATSGTKCYGMMQGTSQACPHVSGVAALGLSYAKKLGKRYTAAEFRSMLLSATNDIDPYLTGGISFQDVTGTRYEFNYPDYKGMMGAGYVDAYKLLLQVQGTPYVVVRTGKESSIDLAPYFGDGLANSEFYQMEMTPEDRESVGFSSISYQNGHLTVKCSKSGAATITVTMLIGGGSLDNNKKPYPTKVTKSFVIISKATPSANGGWL